MTKEASEDIPKLDISKLARSYTQINSDDINIGDLYEHLFQKIFPLVFSLLKKPNTNLSKYECVLRSLPRGYTVPFESKIDFIVAKINKRAEQAGVSSDSLKVNFDRKEILNSAIQSFMSISGLHFALKNLSVKFKEESGIDAGTLTFSLIKKKLKVVSQDSFFHW